MALPRNCNSATLRQQPRCSTQSGLQKPFLEDCSTWTEDRESENATGELTHAPPNLKQKCVHFFCRGEIEQELSNVSLAWTSTLFAPTWSSRTLFFHSPRCVHQGVFTKAHSPRHIFQGAFTKARSRQELLGAQTRSSSTL